MAVEGCVKADWGGKEPGQTLMQQIVVQVTVIRYAYTARDTPTVD